MSITLSLYLGLRKAMSDNIVLRQKAKHSLMGRSVQYEGRLNKKNNNVDKFINHHNFIIISDVLLPQTFLIPLQSFL